MLQVLVYKYCLLQFIILLQAPLGFFSEKKSHIAEETEKGTF